ncbi:RNA polymerase II transcription factor B subunit 1 [Chytriomyces hyalinus]|nr:RNA polymerase II transcription factor B subunit 1 [Chytriomyces hyalinus]
MALAGAAASYKKKNGMLTLSPTVLSFMATSSLDESLMLQVSTIKSQAANVVAEKNKKVILKVSTADAAHNFVFTGGVDPLADRTRFSDALARLLVNSNSISNAAPANTGAITAHDIALRQKLLSNPKNKDLKLLHQDLVISGIISEHDFWASRKELLVNQDWVSGQKKGMSSASLVDVLKVVSGGSSDSNTNTPDIQAQTTYKFTPEVIHSICIQFPAVQLAYEKYVPEKMSEREFWTKYAQSKSFHALKSGKSAALSAAGAGSDEIFGAKEGEVEDDSLPIPKKPRLDPGNKLLDLSCTEEDHLEYGNAPDTTMKPGSYRTALPIIRRLNRHSTVVLKSFGDAKIRPPSKILEEETVLEDLLEPELPKPRELKILQNANYFSGGSAAETVGSGGQVGLDGWTPNLMTLSVDPHKAAKVYAALNNKSLARKVQIPTCKDTMHIQPPDAILQIQASASELLRHYWSFKQKLEHAQDQAANNRGPSASSQIPALVTKLDKLRTAIREVYDRMGGFERTTAQVYGNDVKLLEGVKNAMVVAISS